MITSVPNYSRRRFIVLIFLMMLAVTAGFGWGYLYGVEAGKKGVLKQLEKRLNEAPPSPGM